MGQALESDMAYRPVTTQQQMEKASELITELNEVLSVKNQKQKSVLTSENIIGMNRAEAIQRFTESEYGFRNDVLDNLMENKRDLVKSREGEGIKKLIEIIRTLQAQMQATITPPPNTQLDTLMGRRPPVP